MFAHLTTDDGERATDAGTESETASRSDGTAGIDPRTVALLVGIGIVAALTVSGVAVGPSAAQDSNNSTLEANATLSSQNITPDENVTIDRITLPQKGYVVLHGPSFNASNPTSDSIIGRTQFVQNGSFGNVTFGVNTSKIEGFNGTTPTSVTIYAVPHNETDGDGQFDPTGNGTYDGPFRTSEGDVAYDGANVTLVEEQNTPTATPNGTTGPATRDGQNATETPRNGGNGGNDGGYAVARILGVAVDGTLSNVLLGVSVFLLLLTGTLTIRKM